MNQPKTEKTKIKLCGLTRPCDIAAANRLLPDYIGFVFAKKSRRYVPLEQAAALKKELDPRIRSVGVFVDEAPEQIEQLTNQGIIDVIQLHGHEDAAYIRRLRTLTGAPVIQAFRIDTADDIAAAENSIADFVLLDSGSGGTGTSFDWRLPRTLKRPFFLAGGLNPENVSGAVHCLHPYAVDVSSGIETNGNKDEEKMIRFTAAVRSV